MSVKFDFSQKFVVVTGGARGIGLEISRRFLMAGAQVSVWDYSTESLESARKELSQFGDSVSFTQVDVSKPSSCDSAAAALTIPLDILVNNAGITRDKSLAKMTTEDFEAVINTNLGGVFYVTKALLSKFNSKSDQKRLINISSVVALYGNFGQTNYVASKAGVIGMTKTWARELARKGFTINAIAPGFILTPMVGAMPSESKKGLEEKIPAGRLGQPADIANACLFLASPEASYINGHCLSVDGGMVC